MGKKPQGKLKLDSVIHCGEIAIANSTESGKKMILSDIENLKVDFENLFVEIGDLKEELGNIIYFIFSVENF